MSIASSIADAMDFIVAAGNPRPVQDNQTQQLVSLFATAKYTKTDCTTALKLLMDKPATDIFTPSNRSSMITALSAAGSEIRISTGGDATKVINVSTGQDHMHFEHYLTASDWLQCDKLRDGRVETDHVLSVLANRAAAIGLFYPKPMTCARIAGLVAAMQTNHPDAPLMYAWGRTFKAFIVKLRMMPGRGAAGPSTYPLDPREFMETHPKCYTGKCLPVPPNVDDTNLAASVMHASCRNTNRNVRGRVGTTASKSITDMRHQSDHAPLSDSGFQALLAKFMLTRMVRADSSSDIELLFNQPRRKTNLPQIEAGATDGAKDEPPSPHTPKAIKDRVEDDSDDGGIDAMLKKSAAVLGTKKTNVKKAILKKPAAAAVAKISPVIECTSAPKMPPLSATPPYVYKGAKIYTSVAAECWRVVPKPLLYNYGKTFHWGDAPAATWKLLVKYCESPVIPKGSPKKK